MINLEDNIKIIDGKKYIPYDIAVKAVEENYASTITELDKVQGLIKDALGDFNKTISELDGED
tara:strand:+ start:262 stop:450 length:189 start_codon:yes stop_codon:yes gene_type:complete